MTRARMGLVLLTIAIIVFGLWTSLSRDTSVKAQFTEALATLPGCIVDSDCIVLQTECPLGCAHAIPIDAEVEIRTLAIRLVREHEARFGACAYDCLPAGQAVCNTGRCTLAASAHE